MSEAHQREIEEVDADALAIAGDRHPRPGTADPVRPGPARDDPAATLGQQPIVAVTADQAVRSAATFQAIVARSAVERVIALLPE